MCFISYLLGTAQPVLDIIFIKSLLLLAFSVFCDAHYIGVCAYISLQPMLCACLLYLLPDQTCLRPIREEAAAPAPTTKCKNCTLQKKAVSKKCFYELSAFILFVLCNPLFLVWHSCNNSDELQSTSYTSLAVFLISCRMKVV